MDLETKKQLARLAVALTLAGCSASPHEGQLACGGDEDCPPGWLCNVDGDDMCYSDDSEFPGDTDSDADTDSDGDTDTDVDTDVDSDTDTDTDTDSGSDADTEIDPATCEEAAMVFDFESGAQGFSHGALDGDADPWQLGDPLDQTCLSGTACFATTLSGNYANCLSAELVSPVVDLSVCLDEPLTVELVFHHHYRFQALDSGSWRDGGAVQLSSNSGLTWQDVAPSQVYEGSIDGDYGGPCGGEVADLDGHDAWSGEIPGDTWNDVTVTVDDEFKTDGFRARFLFGSDRSDSETGWVIDDVELAVF